MPSKVSTIIVLAFIDGDSYWDKTDTLGIGRWIGVQILSRARLAACRSFHRILIHRPMNARPNVVDATGMEWMLRDAPESS